MRNQFNNFQIKGKNIKNFKSLRKKIWIFFLLAAIIFNFLTLWPELTTRLDPNDNIFQFGLVQRMAQIWDLVFTGKISPLSLIDHWVPAWVLGYPLPYYYQHLPHLIIVIFYKLLLQKVNLYNIFKIVKFLLWVSYPLALYQSGRWFGFSKITSALMAFFGSQIITDGLYGADIVSFAWRGYGLTTQLFALIFTPLAFAYGWRILNQNKISFRQIAWLTLLLSASFASHLAFGYFVCFSLLFAPLAFLPWERLPYFLTNFAEEKLRWQQLLKPVFKKYQILFLTFLTTFLLLSYWFIPLFLHNQYHNISFWDSPLKWNSYGAKEVIVMFLSGQLFDFGRPPILTALVIGGLFLALSRFKPRHRFLVFLFGFWFALYFGRTTWGKLIDLLPMMREMHQQRLVNSLHIVCIFLIGLFGGFLWRKIKNLAIKLKIKPTFIVSSILFIILGIPVYKANWQYLKLNSSWIKQDNQAYEQIKNDYQALINYLKSLPPGRIYIFKKTKDGQPFNIGQTAIFLALSRETFPTVGFLPETWSLNSDIELLFDENNPQHYRLFNVRWVVLPHDNPLPDFMKEKAVFGPFKVAEVESGGYFTLGTSQLKVKTNKENIFNFLHLWFWSDKPTQNEFPTLELNGEDPQPPVFNSLPYSHFSPPKNLGIIDEEKVEDEKYQAKFTVADSCQNCLLVFKMTYHPNWQVFLDGQKAEKIMVFPSFIALKVSPGAHQVVFYYQPYWLKIPLLIIGWLVFFFFVFKRKFLLRD
ncbi:MAG: YfhO family protein [Microgenomates group bacterium]